MAFYRFGEMTIDEAEKIAKDLGLENGDPYEQVLVTTNGCRFEFEDEHSLYVDNLGAKIWIDVLYGNTKNYRSNVFYWNDKYGDQIPENAIIIGDTQNNGFIVYIYSGLEKGVYYWDDCYAFDCSDKDCNAYRIADDIKSLFENLKITYRKLFARKKKCKPNIEFGEDNMLYRAPDSEKILTIDAAEYKKITHKCKEFKVKFEFTRQYYIEDITRQGIKKVEEGAGYVFSDDIKNFIFDANVKAIKRTFIHICDDSVAGDLTVLRFDDYNFEINAWDINCSGHYVEYAIENGDAQRAEVLRELHKNYVIFARVSNNYFAIEKSTDNIVSFRWGDFKIEKVADDFENFIKGLCDEEDLLRRETEIKKADEDRKPKPIDDINKSECLDLSSSCLGRMGLVAKIIKNDIEDLMVKTGYEHKDRYPDDELSNKYFNYWMLFEEKTTKYKSC